MNEAFQSETEKLERSWMRHDPEMLRDYLVAGVEDPRLNLQSVLSRHFILHALTGERFRELQDQELRFAAAMNWLDRLLPTLSDVEGAAGFLHALRQHADQAEGLEVPAFLRRLFANLPAMAGALTVPNYLESTLAQMAAGLGQSALPPYALSLFGELWRQTLAPETPVQALTVLEPACGSANDYRFLDTYGIARLIDYTGFDLCLSNVLNARAMFPGVRFEVANVFNIPAADRAYDLCFVHDLFEHFSIAAMEKAVTEVCRVTRQCICVGFFQMDECPDHIVRPVDEYYWNKLSLVRMKELFAACGFNARAIHIGSFLRQSFGCEFTHNPDAYTLLLTRETGNPRPEIRRSESGPA